MSSNRTVAFAEESGGGTRISDLYIDNGVLRISGYRGTTVTNCFFNGGSALELAPNVHPPRPLIPSDTTCQYWRGSVCSLVVTNNQFLCANPNQCATINTAPLFPTLAQARMVYLANNAFEGGTNASVCTTPNVHSCTGAASCAGMFARCPA